MEYEEISKIFYEELKDELQRKPMTAAELNNPMDHDKKEPLYNAIFCYSKGEVLFQLDFKIGEKFWLFDDIVIISKDEKYGIVDWRGKLKADYIFSEIIPDKDSLDFIPVKYIDRWGFINKNGKIIKMKIEDE